MGAAAEGVDVEDSGDMGAGAAAAPTVVEMARAEGAAVGWAAGWAAA